MENSRFKFRFWYKPKNRYINTEKLVLNDGTYTQVGTKQMNNGTYCLYIVNEYNSSDVIPEQCTGLKDKNGKLIYEGDIVKLSSDREVVCPVVWDNEETGFCVKYKKELYRFNPYKKYHLIEVIGNIHENASLLEK